jgi:dethiobiotin synthetase
MKHALFITGTGTDIGKTLVAAAICHLLRKAGEDVTYFKPIVAGIRPSKNADPESDISFVGHMANIDLNAKEASLYRFDEPVSPHLAARIAGIKINAERILDNFSMLAKRHDFIIVEGCGGLAVPLNDKGYFLADLIKRMAIPAVITASAQVGTLNHSVLSALFAKQKRLEIIGFILNHFNGFFHEADNAMTIERLTSLPILGKIPSIPDLQTKNPDERKIRNILEKSLSLRTLFPRVLK